ncbi:hypothetical protein [Hyphomicrobium sp.]|uniref:hypothetical protein n=1 Tax=Hyphomicrobium sp. TaxID=82 RepID=UPI000FB4779E|nr:hypothetical protein [Hyphomicrobium sp.]RUP11119.1 MAG: hypothetical protein EKK38_01285 [Hyphomicrobium sp.]
MGLRPNRRWRTAGRWCGGVISALVVGSAIYAIANGRDNMFNFGTGKLSVGRVDASVPNSSLKAFLDQLKVFSQNNRLSYRDSVVDPEGKSFSILMMRKDIAIWATNEIPPDDAHFDFGFYIDPANGGNLDTVHDLIKDLEQGLGETPEVKILHGRSR